MPISYIHYDLQDGFVHNWLVAGPQVISVPDLERFSKESFKEEIARHYHEEDSGITDLPVERGPLTEGLFKVGDYEGAWSYFHCREDHLVDQSGYYSTYHYLRSWAYVQVTNRSKKPRQAMLTLTAYGPTDVWADGQHVHRQEYADGPYPHSTNFEISLRRGSTPILVRFEGVAIGECPHAIALRVCAPVTGKPLPSVRVRFPTTIPDVPFRNELEAAFELAYLDRDVYIREDQILMRWPEDISASVVTMVRLQTASGRIYAESIDKGSPGDTAFLNFPAQIPEGPYRAILMPSIQAYYEDNVRIKRELRLWCLGNRTYSELPYGTYQKRRREALADAAQREGNIFSEIAKMALDKWSAVKSDVLMQAVEAINRREVDAGGYPSIVCLVGLLGILYRFGDDPNFPALLKRPLEDCILNFEYGCDEPGGGAMDYWAESQRAESQRILFHTAEFLAGQRYPDRMFGKDGQAGQWHRERGERLALEWLHERGAGGFEDWDSNWCFEDDLAALSHLIDLAENERVWELASVVMDKLLLTIALNSYRGVFGSTHGRTRAWFVKGGLLEPTSGITRLMWGQGVFNHHVGGTVSLACMESYELPPIIADIASSSAEEMWNRERHVLGDGKEVNKVTYRTPDYMLCSAQDYYPGEEGYQEHIWQATMGPAAVVFVTHPACAREEDAYSPSFWLGNAALPRVAQWKDVLIAIHNLPDDDWMGFTHAYFPIYAFDEYALRDDADGRAWAFARKGAGYLALTAAQGLSLVKQGQSAYRELRSGEQHNVWLCHMGRAALDGDFETFQEKVLVLKVAFDGPSVRCNTLRGESLAFGWEGPLLRDGQEQGLAGFKHYENPYCVADLPCAQMEVRSSDYLLRLSFDAFDAQTDAEE